MSNLPPPPPPPSGNDFEPGPPDHAKAYGTKRVTADTVSFGPGRIHEVIRTQGMTTFTVDTPDIPDDEPLRSWLHAGMHIIPEVPPDPRLVYEQERRDPETGILWRIIGRNDTWVVLEDLDTPNDVPQNFLASQVEKWPVIK